MGVIAWIVLGAIADIIAEHLTGRRFGLLMATFVRIVGALLGGFLAQGVVPRADPPHVLQRQYLGHRHYWRRRSLPAHAGRVRQPSGPPRIEPHAPRPGTPVPADRAGATPPPDGIPDPAPGGYRPGPSATFHHPGRSAAAVGLAGWAQLRTAVPPVPMQAAGGIAAVLRLDLLAARPVLPNGPPVPGPRRLRCGDLAGHNVLVRRRHPTSAGPYTRVLTPRTAGAVADLYEAGRAAAPQRTLSRVGQRD